MKYEPILNDIKRELKGIRRTQVNIFTLIAVLLLFLISKGSKDEDKDISALIKLAYLFIAALNILGLADLLKDLKKE